MYYDLVVYNGELHITNAPVSLTEIEVLDAFGLLGGHIIYGSDYVEDVEKMKHDLENGIVIDDRELMDTYEKIMEEQA